MGKAVWTFIFILMVSFQSWSQQITPFGQFQSDSVRIGEEIRFSLSVEYPNNLDVIFPDSTFDYSPFEFQSKTYFPSRSDSAMIFDSAIYTLMSFEIDSVQKLELPVFVVQGKDSIRVPGYPDSVFFQDMVVDLPDSLKFRENVGFWNVKTAFNYPYFLIGAGIFIVLSALGLYFFGDTIKAKIKLYRLRKDYEKFSMNFERGINNIKKEETKKDLIEEILVIWKKYMERLENRPFTKYTSKEILKAGYAEELKVVLQNIDKSIYGQFDDEQMHKNFESLEDFTLERYRNKLNEIKNG